MSSAEPRLHPDVNQVSLLLVSPAEGVFLICVLCFQQKQCKYRSKGWLRLMCDLASVSTLRISTHAEVCDSDVVVLL